MHELHRPDLIKERVSDPQAAYPCEIHGRSDSSVMFALRCKCEWNDAMEAVVRNSLNYKRLNDRHSIF